MEIEKVWTYTELPAGMYSASIRPMHGGRWHRFQAIPNRGSWCVECIEEDPQVLLEKVDRWIAGESPEGFYSASL